MIPGCEQSSMLTKVEPEYGVFSKETYCSDMDYSDPEKASWLVIGEVAVILTFLPDSSIITD